MGSIIVSARFRWMVHTCCTSTSPPSPLDAESGVLPNVGANPPFRNATAGLAHASYEASLQLMTAFHGFANESKFPRQ